MSAVLALRPTTGPRHRWGFARTSPTRYGVVHHRLIVLPPGSTPADLLRLRLAHEVGWIAPLCGLAVLLVASRLSGALLATVAAVVGTALVVGAERRWTLRVRSGARRLDVCIGLATDALPSRAVADRYWSALGLLVAADAELAAGRIGPVEHEVLWQRAYEELGTAEA